MKNFLSLKLAAGLVFTVLCSAAYPANTEEQRIKFSAWPKYANGPNVAALSQTQQIIDGFEETTGSRIIIRYPGGAAGLKWAEQMRDWFIAYGVPLAYLRLEVGSGAADQLLLIRISP